MCGIVYSMNFNGKAVNNTVLRRYKAQRSRGTEGFGFYIPESNRLTHNVREGRILSLLKRDKASEILFHHRFPTSTSNVRNACHPFSTKDTYGHNYVVVHNGVLQNDDVLQKRHYAEGIKYTSMQDNGSFNDSEALAHDIAQVIEGIVPNLTAAGNIAFIAIQRDHDGDRTALYFGRNYGNPLKMKRTKNSITLSSEGKGENIDPYQLYRWDYATKTLTTTPLDIPEMTYTRSYSYAGYSSGYVYDDEDGLETPNTYGYDSEGRPLIESVARFLDGTGEGYSELVAYERSMVKQKVEELMYNTYENSYDALTLAQDERHWLKQAKTKYDEMLDDDDQVFTDAEINEYCELDDEIRLLDDAIQVLQKGVIAEAASGFHYTPDSGRGLAVC